MSTINFEKSNKLADLDENWYQGVIWVAEYEFEVKIWNFEMADPIWRIKIWKNLMNWRISMRVSFWLPYWIFISHIKFVFSDQSNPLVPIFNEIHSVERPAHFGPTCDFGLHSEGVKFKKKKFKTKFWKVNLAPHTIKYDKNDWANSFIYHNLRLSKYHGPEI